MALAVSVELRDRPETRTPGLITFLKSRKPDETVDIIAFGNNLPHDRFHFELLTEKRGNRIRYTRINEFGFNWALMWFEQEIQSLTQTPKEPVITFENGERWQRKQEERLSGHLSPDLQAILPTLAEMKAKACQALNIRAYV